MDENASALIALLGTQISMIMEDAIDAALTLGRMEHDEMGPAIDHLVHAAASISTFAAALKDLSIRQECARI